YWWTQQVRRDGYQGQSVQRDSGVGTGARTVRGQSRTAVHHQRAARTETGTLRPVGGDQVVRTQLLFTFRAPRKLSSAGSRSRARTVNRSRGPNLWPRSSNWKTFTRSTTPER